MIAYFGLDEALRDGLRETYSLDWRGSAAELGQWWKADPLRQSKQVSCWWPCLMSESSNSHGPRIMAEMAISDANVDRDCSMESGISEVRCPTVVGQACEQGVVELDRCMLRWDAAISMPKPNSQAPNHGLHCQETDLPEVSALSGHTPVSNAWSGVTLGLG